MRVTAQPVCEGRWELGLPAPRYSVPAHVFSPFCRPRASIAVEILPTSCVAPNPHLSTSVTAHTTHCSKEVPNTHVYLVLHTCLPSGHCALFDELLSTQRLHGPTTARCRCTFRPCPSLPISSSRFTRIGTEMTYSNTCDPARPPAESQRSITSQILIPRDKRQEREKKMHTRS